MHNSPWLLLELEPTHNIQKIESAWRRLAKIHHPDRSGDVEKFKLIKSAYDSICSLVSTPINVVVTLCSSEVLREHTSLIEFDYANTPLQYQILIPEWQASWGKNKTIQVKTDQDLDLYIHISLINDELEWNGKQLIWRPSLDLLPVANSGYIEAVWCGHTIKLNIDKHGHAVLLSQGYKTNEGERLDILVQPKYIWPKNDP